MSYFSILVYSRIFPKPVAGGLCSLLCSQAIFVSLVLTCRFVFAAVAAVAAVFAAFVPKLLTRTLLSRHHSTPQLHKEI